MLKRYIVIVMCGIVGYVGNKEAQPILLDCLSKLEYRGYDSCGVAIGESVIKVYKDAVRVAALKSAAPTLQGKIGIGHTRWATHGLPSSINAHPHFDCSRKISVVHNGIITNYQVLRRELINQGHYLASETDTEVIPHLIEKHYRGDLLKAVELALNEIEGSFAIAVLGQGHDYLVASRRDSPLVIGVGEEEKFIASDVPAILNYTNKIIYLEDNDIASIYKDNIQIFNQRNSISRVVYQLHWTKEEVEKSGYTHFMLKEIREQPRVICDSLSDFDPKIENNDSSLILDSRLKDLLMLACGTSYHAALIGKHLIQDLIGIPVRVELGSEFNHCSRIIIPSAAIAITQSGETADVLIPLKKLKQAQTRTLVITNVPNSTASRLADHVIYTRAGPEVSVAATKSFIAQLIELYKIVLSSPESNRAVCEGLIVELRQIPGKIQRIFDNEKQIIDCASFLARYNTVFYIGRGINYPVALEGALKLKEISYIHAEGYPAGELKHGPFALLDKNTPVIAILAQGDVYSSMISNIKEINARQSPIIALADEEDQSIESLVDITLKVPNTINILSPILNTIVLQLLAYYVALIKGCPVDFPRNLAKSVTVE